MAEYSMQETLEEVTEYMGEKIKGKLAKKEDKFRYTTMPLPSASAVALGTVMYIGTTDANFKHGLNYECKAQGTDPETYAWEEVPTELKELTQSQYNALSPAERNNGQMYCITDTKTLMKNGVKYVSKSTEIAEPEVTIDTYTYDGTAQGPTIVSRDTEHTTVTNATATDAGTYTMTIDLNNAGTMMWEDGTTLARQYSYVIEKAEQSFTLDKQSIELLLSDPETTVTATIVSGIGEVVAESLDTSVCRVSVSGTTLTILGTGQGFTTIQVKMQETSNYAESPTLSIRVQASTLKIVSWANGTDEEIAAMVGAADRGEIDLYECGWRVGDERSVSLSSIASSGSYDDISWSVNETTTADTYTLVLMSVGTTSYTAQAGTMATNTQLVTPVKNKDKSNRTNPAFIVGLKEILSSDQNGWASYGGHMNSTNTNTGSWKACARRNWCNAGFRQAIPSALRTIFKKFECLAASVYNGSVNELSEDYFALFAAKEIFGSQSNSNQVEADALVQAEYYTNSANRVKKAGGTGRPWWTRSIVYFNATDFVFINANGTVNWNPPATNNYGISLFGCI